MLVKHKQKSNHILKLCTVYTTHSWNLGWFTIALLTLITTEFPFLTHYEQSETITTNDQPL